MFSTFLLVLLCGFSHASPLREDLYEGSACKLENGKTGVCKKIHDCPSRLKEVIAGKRNSESSGRCSFQGDIEIVCCHLNITEKIGLRPAEIACRQYEENEIDKGRNDIVFHIYGGTAAESGEFPYMVALGYENRNKDDDADNNTEPIKYECGGTLISSQHVLTAAHCVNNVDKKVPIEVRIGSEDLKSGNATQRIPIGDAILHPQYKRSTNYNDVAILKLSSPVRMEKNVRPICIETKSVSAADVSSNVSLIVIGWGSTSFGAETSSRLLKTPSLSFVDRESCAKSYEDFAKLPRGIDENMLCVLDTNVTRRADACGGDSGGPLLMLAGSNHRIVGVTAFGYPCGGPIPSIYTAVHSYLEWIEREVWPEMIEDEKPSTSVFKISASINIRDSSQSNPSSSQFSDSDENW